ncbi:hypothetical protein LCGC14_1576560 [marine sediment metagenome]|uniref:DUF669 domain-containing protein n=1 Tax=marine sediment metagenome TaxID=412755 RepID=A0A0F9LID0_9ZZZZ
MAKKAAEPAVDFSEGDSLMVDLNDVEDVTFEALPRAIYPCVIAECEFNYSQASSNPMWTLVLEVSDGEYTGRKLYSHLVFAGKGLPITKRQLARIAPELFEGPFDPEDENVIASMLGKNIRAKVTQRKYEGEWTNNVRDLFPAGEEAGFGV